MRRQEQFSQLATEESTWTEEQRNKQREIKEQAVAELASSKKYILIAVLVNIVFLIILGMEIRSSREESGKYIQKIQQLSAQLDAKASIQKPIIEEHLNTTHSQTQPTKSSTSILTPQKDDKIQKEESKIMKETLKSVTKDLQEKVNQVKELNAQLEAKDKKIEDISAQIQKKNKEIIELKHQLQSKKQESVNQINELNAQFEAKSKKIEEVSAQIEKKNKEKIELNNQLQSRKQENVNQVKLFNVQLEAKSKKIEEISAQIEKKNKENIELKNQLQSKKLESEKIINQSTKQVEKLQKEIEQMKLKSKLSQNSIKKQQDQITALNDTISSPKQKQEASLYNKTMGQLKKKTVQQRINLAKINSKEKGIELLRYNSQLNQDTPIQENIFYPTNILVDLQISETPFCVIVPSYHDLPIYHIEFSLNSIFRQHYNNFLTILFSSPIEEINNFVLNYLEINKIPKNKYTFIRTSSQKSSLENIYAGINFCQEGAMAVVVEGGHQLLGKYVFKVYNTFNMQFQLGVIYSNFFILREGSSIQYGGTLYLTEDELKNNLYRKSKRSRFQLMAFKVELFKKLSLVDLQDDKGKFFEVPITAIVVPLLELSCMRAKKVTGVFFVMQATDKAYLDLAKQSVVAESIVNRPRKTCEAGFNKTMTENDKNRYPKELEDISNNMFKQKPGMVNTPKGTVSLIDTYAVSNDGKRITDVIYTATQKIARTRYHQWRMDFIKEKQNFQSLHLIKYNLKINNSLDQQQAIDEAKEYARLDTKYNFDSYKQQLPFCIIVPSLNNNVNSRIEYNLNTIFTQNYTNYFVVVINDASEDGSDFIYRSFFRFYNISHQKFAYIENKNRKTALENIHDATFNFCSDDSVTMIVDGDDELIGKNVFKVFNAAHQKLKGGIIYSSYYYYSQGRKVQIGISKDYTLQEKQQVSFRKAQIKYCQLRTHKTALFKALNKTIYQNQKGEFYKVTYDFSTYIPMMELACGKVYYIGGFYYLYNGFTGNNDGYINYSGQIDVVYKVRAKPKLECLPEYKNLTLYK